MYMTRREENKIGPHNLAVCIAPSLCIPRDLLRLMIQVCSSLPFLVSRYCETKRVSLCVYMFVARR